MVLLGCPVEAALAATSKEGEAGENLPLESKRCLFALGSDIEPAEEGVPRSAKGQRAAGVPRGRESRCRDEWLAQARCQRSERRLASSSTRGSTAAEKRAPYSIVRIRKEGQEAWVRAAGDGAARWRMGGGGSGRAM